MTQKQPHPWVTVDAAGLWLHMPDGEGTRAVLLSPDSVHVLIGELAEKAELLKTTDVQKQLASKLVSFGIDWLAKRRAVKS